MISKIEKLKNIGNFEDYTASGNVTLNRLNMIYAENGAGKTTLSRVLHSLSTGDGAIIQRHKRIGSTTNSEVIIKDDTNHRRIYNGTSWNRSMPEIEVFDAHFVANNVYSGFEINSEHHKALYQFVVGASGVAIVNKIERVKNMIAASNGEKQQLAELIATAARNNDVETICRMAPMDKVDEKIATKEKEMELARGQQQIMSQKAPVIINVSAPVFSFMTAKRVLITTVEGVGAAYLEEVKAHLDGMFKAGMEHCSDWVYQGATLLKDGKTCPFCGQSIAGVGLIEGYNQYFSEEYRNAQKNARDLLGLFESVNIESYLVRLKGQYEQIENAHKFWKTVMPEQPDVPAFDVDALNLVEKYNALKAVIVQKSQNPVEVVDMLPLQQYKDALDAVDILCEQVNAYVRDYANKITELRSKLRAVAEVEGELRQLQLNKARYSEPLLGQCVKYDIVGHQLERLKRINTDLQQQQKAASTALFQQYGTVINNYLQNVFMTPFQITNVKDMFKGGSKKPNLEYTLTFNGTPILQGDDGMSNTSFKNVLSEGDKNTIAFSFFLAKLTSDPHFANKIIVFDDPLTSLDLNRRNETINQLVLLHSRCKQVIVLSHNFHFLVDLNARNDVKAVDKKVLTIVKGRNNATIQEYELNREWMDKYKRSIEKMEAFVNIPSPTGQEDAVVSIRITSEMLLKLKFCKYISNQNCTFGELISVLEASACSFVNPDKNAVITKLRNLNSVSWRPHHASVEERAVYQEVTLTMAEAVNYVNMALQMLYSEL